jgi:hypothetical protein
MGDDMTRQRSSPRRPRPSRDERVLRERIQKFTYQERLDEAEEFLFVGPAAEDESADAYVWVLRGRSRVAEVPIVRGQIEHVEDEYRDLEDLGTPARNRCPAARCMRARGSGRPTWQSCARATGASTS